MIAQTVRLLIAISTRNNDKISRFKNNIHGLLNKYDLFNKYDLLLAIFIIKEHQLNIYRINITMTK